MELRGPTKKLNMEIGGSGTSSAWADTARCGGVSPLLVTAGIYARGIKGTK
jgi:hypothetical protein